MKVRTQTTYYGRVQGVGFRWQVCRAVEPFEVTGFVRNKSDGSVETLLEGETQVIERALATLEARLKDFGGVRQPIAGKGQRIFATFQLSIEGDWHRFRLIRAIAVPYCWW